MALYVFVNSSFKYWALSRLLYLLYYCIWVHRSNYFNFTRTKSPFFIRKELKFRCCAKFAEIVQPDTDRQAEIFSSFLINGLYKVRLKIDFFSSYLDSFL